MVLIPRAETTPVESCRVVKLEYSGCTGGYKCDKCRCRSGRTYAVLMTVDTNLCPWHRQKLRSNGVDVHSYPRRTSTHNGCLLLHSDYSTGNGAKTSGCDEELPQQSQSRHLYARGYIHMTILRSRLLMPRNRL